MERIERILKHPVFIECMKKNEMAEADRCFCHHDIEHLRAVAHIAMLTNMEEGINIAKDVIYAAALLHDCGRHRQYTEGVEHEIAGAEYARLILPACGYEEEEVNRIVTAIASHRGKMSVGDACFADEKEENKLAWLIKYADKMSRNCRFCKAYDDCNWSEEQKSHPFL